MIHDSRSYLVDVGEKVVVFRWKNPFLDSAQKVISGFRMLDFQLLYGIFYPYIAMCLYVRTYSL
jgi:hypothetical protein